MISLWNNKVYTKREVSRLSIEKLWSHSAEKFVGEPFDVSKKIRLSKNFMQRREGGGSIMISRIKILVSQYQKNS